MFYIKLHFLIHSFRKHLLGIYHMTSILLSSWDAPLKKAKPQRQGSFPPGAHDDVLEKPDPPPPPTITAQCRLGWVFTCTHCSEYVSGCRGCQLPLLSSGKAFVTRCSLSRALGRGGRVGVVSWEGGRHHKCTRKHGVLGTDQGWLCVALSST